MYTLSSDPFERLKFFIDRVCLDPKGEVNIKVFRENFNNTSLQNNVEIHSRLMDEIKKRDINSLEWNYSNNHNKEKKILEKLNQLLATVEIELGKKLHEIFHFENNNTVRLAIKLLGYCAASSINNVIYFEEEFAKIPEIEELTLLYNFVELLEENAIFLPQGLQNIILKKIQCEINFREEANVVYSEQDSSSAVDGDISPYAPEYDGYHRFNEVADNEKMGSTEFTLFSVCPIKVIQSGLPLSELIKEAQNNASESEEEKEAPSYASIVRNGFHK